LRCKFAASPIAFISHEPKQVVIQFSIEPSTPVMFLIIALSVVQSVTLFVNYLLSVSDVKLGLDDVQPFSFTRTKYYLVTNTTLVRFLYIRIISINSMTVHVLV